MNRRDLLKSGAGAVGLAMAPTIARRALAADALKVGFIYVGSASDFGWSYQHDVGRKDMEAAFPGQVTSTFVELVPEGADAERVITQMVNGGHGLIFTTSFGYMEPTLKVAKRFPKIKFEHCTGYKRAPNVATYSARFYEGRYLAGVIAGKMSASGKIGYVCPFPIPEVIHGMAAFTQGLRGVNPNATVNPIFVSSWFDPGKEAAAANALLDQKCDVIAQHTDSAAPVQVANERGAYAIGESSDMIRFGPKSQLTAVTNYWSGYYIERARAALNGTWSSIDTWGGLKDGMLRLAPLNAAVPGEVEQLIASYKEEIILGKRHPLAGPIYDQSGALRVPAGKAMTDGEILGMNWYVQGIVGSIPS